MFKSTISILNAFSLATFHFKMVLLRKLAVEFIIHIFVKLGYITVLPVAVLVKSGDLDDTAEMKLFWFDNPIVYSKDQ